MLLTLCGSEELHFAKNILMTKSMSSHNKKNGNLAANKID